MSTGISQPAEIHDLLSRAKVVAVVGVSDKPERASNSVAQYLQRNSHFSLYFVNPLLDEVLGQKSYKSLVEIPEPIDIVDVFRKSEDCLSVAEEAIQVGARAIWLQLGISSADVANRASQAGMKVVMDRCIKIDYDALIKK